MNKKCCAAQLNKVLKYTLMTYQASAGITQEELAFRMRLTPRACSALENGEYGFSVMSTIVLCTLLPLTERVCLLLDLCALVQAWLDEFE